ncbi:HupE/UreJ family protein [Marinobacter sp. SS21]|uniref:HupE/UreJ family protein n=1 Tax=Marinobacter sp. SS21 TaxID=2979460 RepID=UPI00232C02A9|nr:HupE/UreJ family protein [Marinobacter sp. SS21]MDC0661137.1 HupE/UreJ family protein [Marinobacter sp. SS21]
MARFTGFLLLLMLACPAWPHKASDGFMYLTLAEQELPSLRLDFALRDLTLALPMDNNGDGRLTGAELRQAQPAIAHYLSERVTVTNDQGPCRFEPRHWGISRHSDGVYAATAIDLHCPGDGQPLSLRYSALFDRDTLHRGLLLVQRGEHQQLAVIAPDTGPVSLAGNGTSPIQTFVSFLEEGVIHLLVGLDHLLFLLVLVIPVSLTNVGSLRKRLWRLSGVVSAFTLAHSVTLALAALGTLTLPINWVETVIALSIGVAALNIVWPLLGPDTWKLAFGFGLIHGFGFASVLGELTTGTSQQALALAGFNLGVELGQLMLLVVGFPLLYLLARFSWYRRALVPALIVAVCGVSLVWVVERIPVL